MTQDKSKVRHPETTSEIAVTPVTQINISVKTMCERLGLSRSRVSQLISAGVLVGPARDERSGRPYFNAEAVEQNLRVRKTGVGANGQPALFYSARARPDVTPAAKKKQNLASTRSTAPADDEVVKELVSDLTALGLVNVSKAEVEMALTQLRSGGATDPDTRAVYRQIKRKRTADS